MANNEQEYHRRRLEMELDLAVAAEQPESAWAHLTLARMHRDRRGSLAQESLKSLRKRNPAPIFRADKEA